MLLSIEHPVIRTVIRTKEWRAWLYPKSALTTGLRTNATWGRGAGSSATSFSHGWRRAPGLHWIDIGCGNGAFTEQIVERFAPAELQGIDPSEAQLIFARSRPAARLAEFRQGDAMALPFADGRFDAAVMALVIFFVPEPAKGVAEMARVVRPGGVIATYAWDLLGGGFPLEPIQAELRGMGISPVLPPSAPASRIEALRTLWTGAGVTAIETREISVQRTFANFDEFWAIAQLAPSLRPTTAAMSSQDMERLKARVHARLTADAAGRITYTARANAIKGHKS
jgi:SAM-dependent methyltransferase